MLDPSRYGEYFADGSSRTPEASALSGKPIHKGDGYVQATLTPHHFVYVTANERRSLAQADWNALKADWKRQFEGAAQPVAPDVVETDAPDFTAMSASELRQYATDNSIDISGLRSQADLATAVRAETVRRQFDAPAVITESVDASASAEGSI